MRECTSRGDECEPQLPSGGCGAKFGALEATSGQPRRVRITPAVAFEDVLYLPSGGCSAPWKRTGGNSGTATPSARVTPVVVSDPCCASLGRVANPGAGGNFSAAPLHVRESRLSWRLDGRCPLSGVQCESGSSGACSRVVTNCENQTIAPVVAWLRAAISSEDAGWRRSTGLISCAATPRAKSAIATSVCAPRLSREERYGNRVSAGMWTPPPSGGEAPAPCR